MINNRIICKYMPGDLQNNLKGEAGDQKDDEQEEELTYVRLERHLLLPRPPFQST